MFWKNYSRRQVTKGPSISASYKSIYRPIEIHFKNKEEISFSPPTREVFSNVTALVTAKYFLVVRLDSDKPVIACYSLLTSSLSLNTPFF